MAEVHVKSRWSKLAKTMSWPLGTSAIADAVRARPEPMVWLGVYHWECVKKWSQRGGREERLARCCVFSIEYTEADVRRRVDWEKSFARSQKPPAWLEMDDPPLLSSTVYSLPAAVMRSSGLTRAVAADVITKALQAFPRGSITAQDWLLSLDLHANDRCLHLRTFVRPVREWELVSDTAIQLGEEQ